MLNKNDPSRILLTVAVRTMIERILKTPRGERDAQEVLDAFMADNELTHADLGEVVHQQLYTKLTKGAKLYSKVQQILIGANEASENNITADEVTEVLELLEGPLNVNL